MSSSDPFPTAMYLRMSTEHQRYSLQNQSAAIERYASIHGFTIIKTYSDAGKSGVTLRKRTRLRELLRDVTAGNIPFRAILVYDVSRWGRFQDADEAAHYEFVCKSAGIPIHYCAEQFQNDGTMPNAVMKALKRTMAGEYSRELGEKVLAAQKRLASLGFKQGGIAGYGLRRMQVSPDGDRKYLLRSGELKNVPTDRVVLVPGPAHEIETVREIYRMLVEDGRKIHAIFHQLNRRGVPYLEGSPWNHNAVNRILTHPKYAGCSVFNLNSQRLGSPKSLPTPRSEWIVIADAYEPVVDRVTFEKAQAILERRTTEKSDAELLDGLRRILAEKGQLSATIISRSPQIPCVSVYSHRFGGLLKAYDLIGYQAAAQDLTGMKHRARTLIMREGLVSKLLTMFPEDLALLRTNNKWRARFNVRNGPILSLQVSTLQPKTRYTQRWRIAPNEQEQKNVTLVARLTEGNYAFHDFHVLPDIDRKKNFHIRDVDAWLKRGRPLADLSHLVEIVREVQGAKESRGLRDTSLRQARWSGVKGARFV
ncbi:MAG TPA: recombinase family protein [Terriglobales bacterium]|jgi:DNA invertase Pin-like site-specific DNA recombinase|nr:recombinase family protein [Terriglobales bacterium]